MNQKRPVPEAAIQLVKEFEGLRVAAYPDPGTKGAPWTVGYGHTTGVFKDTHVGPDQANRLLQLDLEEAGRQIENIVKVPLNENEWAALLVFVFNVGAGNLKGSTLLKLLNEGNRQEAASEFLRWNKAAGKELAGLTRRRIKERELFLKEPTSES
jgi:lysozyme